MLSLFTPFAAYSVNARAASYLQDRVICIQGTVGPDAIQVSDDGNQWKLQADY